MSIKSKEFWPPERALPEGTIMGPAFDSMEEIEKMDLGPGTIHYANPPPPERNILKEANEIINADRPSKYGPVEESYAKVAALASAAGVEIDAEGALKVMIAVKLVRDSYSPVNPDHLRDAAGYIGLLDQLRQRRRP